MTSFSHDMMTRGRGGVWIPPKSDDVIYEQPLTVFDVDGEDNVGNSLLQIWELTFGSKAQLLFRL